MSRTCGFCGSTGTAKSIKRIGAEDICDACLEKLDTFMEVLDRANAASVMTPELDNEIDSVMGQFRYVNPNWLTIAFNSRRKSKQAA